MTASRIVFKRDAFYNLRSSPEVVRELERRGRAVLEAAGGEEAGYMMSSSQGQKNPQGRWRVAVFTSNAKSMVDNQRHNTLIRSFGAAHG